MSNDEGAAKVEQDIGSKAEELTADQPSEAKASVEGDSEVGDLKKDGKKENVDSKQDGGDLAAEDDAGVKPGKIKRRKKKDPSAPKRPLSAYNLYFRDTRQELKESSDSRLSFESLVKTVSAQWKAVDAETRAKYEQRAKLDYDRYNEEMKVYQNRPEIQNSLVDPSASKGRRKFLGVPKRPLSGYNIFFREEHARIKRARGEAGDEGEEGSNMTVEIAKRWSQLDVKEKSELNQRAAATQKAIETAEIQRETSLREAKGPKLVAQMAMARGGFPPAGYMAPGMHPALMAHFGGGEDAARNGHMPHMAYGAPGGYMGHPHQAGGRDGGGDQAALAAQQQAQWQHEQHMRFLMQFQQQQQAQLMGGGHPAAGHPGMAAVQQQVPGGQPGMPPVADQNHQVMMAQHQAMMQWQQQEWARQQWQQQQQYHQQQQQQQQQQPQGQQQPRHGGMMDGQQANPQWGGQQVNM